MQVNFRYTFLRLKCFDRMIFLIFVLPCVALAAFFAAIGRDPQYLKLAVVNDEMNHNYYDKCKNLTDYPFSMLSCRYLFHLDKKTIIQV